MNVTPFPNVPAGLPTLDAAQTDAVLRFMEDAGRSRAREQGADFSEIDYLAGCMAGLAVLGIVVPPRWIFPVFRGESPLGLAPLDPTVFVVCADTGTGSRRHTVYRHRRDATEHLDYLDSTGRDVMFAEEPARRQLHPAIDQALDAELAADAN